MGDTRLKGHVTLSGAFRMGGEYRTATEDDSSRFCNRNAPAMPTEARVRFTRQEHLSDLFEP
jgi:hypothetical protein